MEIFLAIKFRHRGKGVIEHLFWDTPYSRDRERVVCGFFRPRRRTQIPRSAYKPAAIETRRFHTLGINISRASLTETSPRKIAPALRFTKLNSYSPTKFPRMNATNVHPHDFHLCWPILIYKFLA